MMKKFSVLMVALVASVTLASAQGWGIGGRLGSGVQAVGQLQLNSGNYLEGRLGMDWIYGDITADFSVLHVWNVANMDLTDEGNWFFDLGAGVFLGGASNYFVGGVQGMAKFGYTFEDYPVSIGLDWSPSFGPEVIYTPEMNVGGIHVSRMSTSRFNGHGLANFGLSVVYRF
jgi:hypothetical protein